jgi:aminopeptidase N
MKRGERSLRLNKIQYPGDDRFDVTYYKLDITIASVAKKKISGNVVVNGKSLADSLQSIYLDLQSVLNVDSVLGKNGKLGFSHLDNKLHINFNSAINLGEEFSIAVYYGGTPGSSGFGSFEFGSHNGAASIYTLSEPYGASDWWPCKDTPADKADSSDVWITCATSLIPVSNGKLIEVVTNPGSTHTYKWKNSYPIANYLISLAISNFVEYEQYFKYSETDSMPVIHYIYPEHFNQVKPELDKTIKMLEIFSEKFGEYPFLKEKYGHAQFGWGGGMEHQTVSSMGFYAFNPSTISHELAHQWFGDKITCKDWHNIWLNEGFATYSEGIYFEALNGKNAYKNFINTEMYYAKLAKGSIYVKNISMVNEIFNSYRSYAKAGIVLHMLRGVLGDSLFFRTLKEYANHPEFSYGVAVTEDFQAVTEKVSGHQLEYFFKQWIYGENFPVYSVYWNYNQQDENNYTVNVHINQSVNSNPAFFSMPIQLRILTQTQDTIITVFNDQQSQSFSFTVRGVPYSLVFDPENWILKEVSVVLSAESDEQKPLEFTLYQNYPNPFNPSTKIKYTIPSSDSPLLGGKRGELITLKVFDILGREVAVLVNEEKAPGVYEVEYTPLNTHHNVSLPGGVYFYQIKVEDYIQTKKMILLR